MQQPDYVVGIYAATSGIQATEALQPVPELLNSLSMLKINTTRSAFMFEIAKEAYLNALLHASMTGLNGVNYSSFDWLVFSFFRILIDIPLCGLSFPLFHIACQIWLHVAF